MSVLRVKVGARLLVPRPLAPRAAELFDALKKLCTHENPKYKDWLAFRAKRGRSRFPPNKTIETFKELSDGLLSLPAGRLRRAGKAAAEHGFELVVDVDHRVGRDPLWIDYYWRGPDLWPHQRDLVDEAKVAFDDGPLSGTCMWRSPPRSGKTRAVLKLVSELGCTALIVVPTTKIFDQWVKACEEMLGFTPGRLGAGKKSLGVITIAMQQTAAAMSQELSDKFVLLVGDEIQGHASATCQVLANASRARFRLGVSADERRADAREELIYDQFGTRIIEVDKPALQRSGEIVPVDVVLVVTRFAAEWYRRLGPNDKFLERSRLIDQMAGDRGRNELIEYTFRAFCRGQGEQALVITSRVEHARTLAAMLDGTLLLGHQEGEPKGMFSANCEAFAAGAYGAAVGTEKSVGVGFESHRALGRVILTMPFASKHGSRMQVEQFIDRAATASPGKEKGVAYYMLDADVFGVKPAELFAKWYPATRVLEPSATEGPRLYAVKDWIRANRSRAKVSA